MEKDIITTHDLFEIFKRRKWSLMIPAFFVLMLTFIWAISLPPVYKSTATMLIEDSDIPKDFVTGSFSGYIEQRIESIKRKSQSSARLLEVINKHNLYQDQRDLLKPEELVDKLRESIWVKVISEDVVDRWTGRDSKIAIAFTITYSSEEEPVKVFEVTEEVTAMFLDQNIQDRKKQTAGTLNFLELEFNKVKLDLEKSEAEISNFRKEHINELPEFLNANLQRIDSTEREIQLLNDNLRSLKERKSSLSTQLAAIPASIGTQKEETKLEELKMHLIDLKSRFSDAYPDVIKTKAEIEKLQKQNKESSKSSNRIDRKSDNPIYVTLASELAGIKIEIESTTEKINELKQDVEEYRIRVAATTNIEPEYKALTIKRDNLKLKANDLMSKLMEAKVIQGFEKEQKGVRFTLIEPPKIPLKPYKPKKRIIILIGLILAIGAGIVTASIIEFSDTSVRSAEQLVEATSFPVLASIPYIKKANILS